MSPQQINEIAWFFACWYKFTEIKSWSKTFWMGMVRNGCGQVSHGTGMLAVLQEWIDGMNWFFACWCKYRKAKIYFNDFSFGLVKNGHGYLVHETLKSGEWVYGLSWFFACWLWWNNFLLDQHCTSLLTSVWVFCLEFDH